MSRTIIGSPMSKPHKRRWPDLFFVLGIELFGCNPAFPAEGKAVASFGDWSVTLHANSMTDKKSCISIYKSDPQIQLGAESLYISLRGRGGVRGYQIRVNDEKADKLHLASEIERKAAVVEFRGEAFDRLKTAKRLRVEVITILDNLREYDIALEQNSELRKFISSDACK
jgi:hypothetical protein